MFIKFPVLYPQLFPLISGSRAHERNKDDKKTAWSGTVAHIMRLQYPRFRLSILVDTSPWSSLIKVTSSVFCPLSVVLHFVSFAGLSFDLKIKKINEIHFKKKLNKNAEWVLIPSQNFNNWDNENLVVIILIIFIAIHIFQFLAWRTLAVYVPWMKWSFCEIMSITQRIFCKPMFLIKIGRIKTFLYHRWLKW